MATRSIGGALSQILSETTIPIFAAKVILLFCKRQLYMKKKQQKNAVLMLNRAKHHCAFAQSA